MNLYHCMLELKSEAKALAFAAAAQSWLDGLQDRGLILGWRLMRRKFGLASARHTDFMLEIEVQDMAQLEEAFRTFSAGSDEDADRYDRMHQMIGSVEIGLFRPYPDPAQRERIALI